MTDKRKDLLLYIILSVGVVIIITTYIFIYLSQTNNDYLYFSKIKISADYGSQMSLAELGLNTNIDVDDLKIYCCRAKFSNGYVMFDKAGDSVINVEHDKLKASLQVGVSFDNVSAHLSIYANVDDSSVNLTDESVIELYLPSTDRDLATSAGYINSFGLGVEYFTTEDSYNIIASNNLSVVDGVVYAKGLGLGNVYLEFDNFGKSFVFDVLVKEIAVQDITSDYSFDTVYVDRGSFDLSVNILPNYATNKNLEVAISGQSVVYSGGNFCGVEYGESFVTFSSDDISLIIKVVVCEKPDDIKVTIVSNFIYGQKGIASVNLHKSGELIDGEYYLEFYIAGVMVSGDTLVQNLEIKHNAFSLDVISEESFVIRLVAKQNISLTFDISVNN